jgi:protein TonB
MEKGIGYGCDEEALRLINKMQSDNIKWKPGKNNGREVIVLFTLLIGFKL